jgi:DNA-binding FrmR family transcriptional regulator
MTSINRNHPSPLPNSKPADTRSKLENLYKTLGELRKQLRSLHKRLEEAGDVAERMAIREQIRAVEEMVEAVRRQILAITQLEKRKHGAKLEIPVPDVQTDSPAEGTGTQAPGDLTYKPPYDLGD